MRAFLLKLGWMWQLLRSKSYVLLTDTAAVTHLKMRNIESLEDLFIVTAQSAELREFSTRLEELIEQHDKTFAKLIGDTDVPAPKKATRKSAPKKKPVAKV